MNDLEVLQDESSDCIPLRDLNNDLTIGFEDFADISKRKVMQDWIQSK